MSFPSCLECLPGQQGVISFFLFFFFFPSPCHLSPAAHEQKQSRGSEMEPVERRASTD